MAARPYGGMLQQVLSNVAAAAAGNEAFAESPLLRPRPENRILLLLLTSDRGLAGAFNTNLIRGAQKFLDDHSGKTVELELLGRKGRDFFRRRAFTIAGEYVGVFERPAYQTAADIGKKVVERLNNDEIDAVYLLYNEFKSVLSQKLTITRILPIVPPEGDVVDYIYEQPPEELLAALLPKYVEVQIYTAMLESTAAEHAARMTAMDSATSNASDVIDKLTLYMNRVRQASITREIIEVVSGASALE